MSQDTFSHKMDFKIEFVNLEEVHRSENIL